MDEKQLEAALNAIGTLSHGTVVINKEMGNDEVTVETKAHPIISLFLIANALGNELIRAGNTDDQLELDLTPENVHNLLHGFADSVEQTVLEHLKKEE